MSTPRFFAPLASLLLVLASTAMADPYGKLFTTPAQRAWLDARGHAATSVADGTAEGGGEAAAPLPAIEFNGTLVSSSGGREIWINGRREAPGRPLSGYRIRPLGEDRLRLQTADGARARTLKAGQLLLPASGRIVEGFARAEPAHAGSPEATDSVPAAAMP